MAQAMELELDESQEPHLCTECEELPAPGEIRRLKKLFCSKCWIHHCNFRFRKRLYELGKPPKGLAATSSSVGSSMQSVDSGATCLRRPNFPVENVIVDYDAASEHSIALLYLLRDAVVDNLEVLSTTDRPKTLPFPFTFTILFISAGVHENGEINLNKKENIRVKNFERLKSWYKETKALPRVGDYFPFLLVSSIEESLTIAKDVASEFNLVDISNQIDAPLSFPLNSHQHEKLVSVIEDLRTKTSRIDLLQILRHNLTEAIAARIGSTKILVVEDQTNLAVKMFALMSIGRGAQLADQMDFVTDGDHAVFAKPLMDLSSDDLRDYMRCMQLIELSNVEPDVRNIDNIKSQCEDFVKGLQKDYPATVPTLTRIGGKLERGQPNACRKSNLSTCGVRPPSDVELPETKSCRLCKNTLDHDKPQPIEAKSLCYACSRIMQEMKTPSLLLEMLKDQPQH